MGVQLNQLNLDGFNTNEVVPDSFDDLPAGQYPAVVTDSVLKETQSKTGRYIEFAFEVVDGPFAGRKFWDRLNIDNPNVMTREIAAKQLSAIARAVGIFGPLGSTDEVHDKPLLVNITYKIKNGESNARYRYSPLTGGIGNVDSGQSAANAGGGAARAVSGGASGAKPWER